MNEQQLRALVPALGAVIHGHDFETSVSALSSVLIFQIANNVPREDVVSYTNNLAAALVNAVTSGEVRQ